MNTKLLFVAFSLFTLQSTLAQAPAVAQPPPAQTDGFLDVPWGSDPESAKKPFASRTRSRLDRAARSNEKLQFIGGKFAGLKVSKFDLHFASDRFWKADVVFEAVSKDHRKEFATLKQLLIEKYGPPSSDNMHGDDLTVEWYLPGIPGTDKDKINLTTDIRGNGMKLFYAADRIARQPVGAPKAPDAASKTKPIPVAPKAKDDL